MDSHVMPFGLELVRQAFVERGESTAVGPCCADDDDIHECWCGYEGADMGLGCGVIVGRR